MEIDSIVFFVGCKAIVCHVFFALIARSSLLLQAVVASGVLTCCRQQADDENAVLSQPVDCLHGTNAVIKVLPTAIQTRNLIAKLKGLEES